VSGASVVIVGGGVMGASAAYHLAARGWKNVLILDRASHAGLGSTGRATGGFRAQFSTTVNVKLSLLAREKLLRFGEEIGVDPLYVRAGYLWLARTEAERGLLRDGRATQQAAGLVEAREVSPADIAELNPALRMDGILGGSFCASDGFIAPARLLEGFLAAALRLGARIEWNTEVMGFERRGDRITHVVTARQNIAADFVINAAGPWAGAVARLAAADLPVVPLRRQVAATVPQDALPETMPMTIFMDDGFHLRVRDRRALLLWPTPGISGQPFDDTLDLDWVAGVSAIARERLPVLAQVETDRAASWAGLYEMTPDRHSVIGPAPECPNLFYMNGSSGHGVMHSPALGQLVAEILSDGKATSVDVSALSPTRFTAETTTRAADVL
jgi:glycine/D-amino acid oxidase-like deaminating enzyme